MRRAYLSTGSRDDSQRYPRERSKPAPHRQYKTGVSPIDSNQAASILKTRAFKLLTSAVGTENIVLALDSNLARVTELENGVGFTPETAFHMETTLGLPDGFFDQPNPILPPETIARLKSPVALWGANADLAYAHEEVGSIVVVDQTTVHGSPEDELPAELQMLKNERISAIQNAAKNSATAAPRRKIVSVEKAPYAESKDLRKPGSRQSLALNDSRALAEIRRVNLHTLTKRKGAKSQLGRLLEMSHSNMAHRLHGQKRMDDIEAQRFTDKLGLPAGWLDIPREPTDVPEAVAALLSPPPSRQLSAQLDNLHLRAKPSVQTSPKEALPAKNAPRKHAPLVATGDRALSAVTLPKATSELPSGQTSKNDPSIKPALRDGAAASVFSNLPNACLCTSVTNVETLWGIAPIAEALIKTLAGKARTGRLDETRALQFLQQAVLL